MIQWEDTMSVGIWKMDQQHKRWLELMNALSEGIREKRSQEVLEELFVGVLEYTQTHFADEEELLKHANYPDLDQQIKAHKELIQKMHELKQQFTAKNFGVTMDLMKVMTDWLIHHIRNADKKYGEFVARKH